MKKKFSIILLLLFFISPVHAQESITVNAGYVNGIWFSQEPFFIGETIRIYTVIQNQSGYDVSGTLVFLLDGEQIGDSIQFNIVDGMIKQVWTDWTVDKENLLFSLDIPVLHRNITGQEPELVLTRTESENMQVSTYADVDTDGDRIGNKDDLDDDNDGLLDTEELALGTNPLNEDTDNDGFSDSKEIALNTDPLSQNNSPNKNNNGVVSGNSITVGRSDDRTSTTSISADIKEVVSTISKDSMQKLNTFLEYLHENVKSEKQRIQNTTRRNTQDSIQKTPLDKELVNQLDTVDTKGLPKETIEEKQKVKELGILDKIFSILKFAIHTVFDYVIPAAYSASLSVASFILTFNMIAYIFIVTLFGFILRLFYKHYKMDD